MRFILTLIAVPALVLGLTSAADACDRVAIVSNASVANVPGSRVLFVPTNDVIVSNLRSNVAVVNVARPVAVIRPSITVTETRGPLGFVRSRTTIISR